MVVQYQLPVGSCNGSCNSSCNSRTCSCDSSNNSKTCQVEIRLLAAICTSLSLFEWVFLSCLRNDTVKHPK